MVDDKKNSIALALTTLGILAIVIGIILGISSSISNDPYIEGELVQSSFGWGIAINGIIVGILFLGFAEIIKLLQGIYNQQRYQNGLYEQLSTDRKESSNSRDASSDIVSDQERHEITEYFHADKVEEIKRTSQEDIYLVTVNQQKVVVELGGFKPVVIPEEKAKELGIL
ncbi:hypothetical protein [Bacillus suaedaesalsae]|uniref:Uncharacterized protein n=1 Tax=Bacillus suaedaesalsae TaxID=2810349 RepID=A0ABS2DIK3_9BACI|nr:hypothetical protein [Bacillus suaedaesalsae]MBM6618324.1 hypothetical protein [Bacillus suaedaesalsae]